MYELTVILGAILSRYDGLRRSVSKQLKAGDYGYNTRLSDLAWNALDHTNTNPPPKKHLYLR